MSQKLVILSLLISLIHFGISNLPPLYSFAFTPTGLPTVVSGRIKTECDMKVSDSDKNDAITGNYNITLVVLAGSGDKCWSNAKYSNGDYSIGSGIIADSTNEFSYPAYIISAPTSEASEFVASGTGIFLSFSTIVEQNIYSFDGKEFELLDTVIVGELDVWIKTTITVDKITKDLVLFAVSSSTTPTIWPKLRNDVEGAIVHQDSQYNVLAMRFDIGPNMSPFNPSKDWNHGPKDWNYRYGTLKRFFVVYKSNGDEGVVWQDTVTLSVYVTWMGTKLQSHNNINLAIPTQREYYLEAAAGNNNGDIALVLLAIDPLVDDKVTSNSLKGFKFDMNGNILVEVDYDTSKNGLNIYEFFQSGASMVWNTETNQIGLMISRIMTQSSDTLNHQSCIAVIINGADMSVIKRVGQLSSHSWSNSLSVGSNGKFLGADLGDNYPRGINLHEFDANKKRNKVVYEFKTKHRPDGKSSNDNEVYTELAHNAVIEVDNSSALLVIFAGEYPSLDNSKVGTSHNAPRNIAFVKVPSDMDNKNVLSDGPVEKSHFYNFGGTKVDQENKGIVWLTGWNNKELDNASRLKAISLGTGKILVLFEKWTPSAYVSTHLMGLNENGAVIHPESTSNYNFRIPFADEIQKTNFGSVIFYSGLPGKLVRYEVVIHGKAGSGISSNKGIINGKGVTKSFLFALMSLILVC